MTTPTLISMTSQFTKNSAHICTTSPLPAVSNASEKKPSPAYVEKSQTAPQRVQTARPDLSTTAAAIEMRDIAPYETIDCATHAYPRV